MNQQRSGDIHAVKHENEIMGSYLFILVITFALFAPGQEPAISPGVVHGSVAVAADSSNSYALYLPSNYSAARRWPLLLVFDPFARGEVSVKLFHDAAEKYGFIVVGSNNSRNFADPSNAILLLWADVKEHYTIDPKRIYTAGLSGGAPVASSIALACKHSITGMLPNVAAFPPSASVRGPDVCAW